jgi:hypothetical protein
MTMPGLSSAAPSALRSPQRQTSTTNQNESARMNTNKMPIKAEREGSRAPECQRREIKIPRKRACRGLYFSRPIRVANASLSAIRVNLGKFDSLAPALSCPSGQPLVDLPPTGPDALLWLRFPPTE